MSHMHALYTPTNNGQTDAVGPYTRDRYRHVCHLIWMIPSNIADYWPNCWQLTLGWRVYCTQCSAWSMV